MCEQSQKLTSSEQKKTWKQRHGREREKRTEIKTKCDSLKPVFNVRRANAIQFHSERANEILSRWLFFHTRSGIFQCVFDLRVPLDYYALWTSSATEQRAPRCATAIDDIFSACITQLHIRMLCAFRDFNASHSIIMIIICLKYKSHSHFGMINTIGKMLSIWLVRGNCFYYLSHGTACTSWVVAWIRLSGIFLRSVSASTALFPHNFAFENCLFSPQFTTYTFNIDY